MSKETKIHLNACGTSGQTAWAVSSADGNEDYARGEEPTFGKAQNAAKKAQGEHYMKTRRDK